MLAGRSMLSHVCNAAQQVTDATVLVATDDQRIFNHAAEIGIQAVMTPSECPSGTDRVLAAIQIAKIDADKIINLQGDAPLTPVKVLQDIADALKVHDVVTPAVQLSWEALDRLRATKQSTPFSGTSVVVNEQGEALWFSKQIIPAVRNEEKLRSISEDSPVLQHIGIYGYSRKMLELFTQLPQGRLEQLEGLEQLRLLENGIKINVTQVELADRNVWRGVDTPEDLELVEQHILESVE